MKNTAEHCAKMGKVFVPPVNQEEHKEKQRRKMLIVLNSDAVATGQSTEELISRVGWSAAKEQLERPMRPDRDRILPRPRRGPT